jgi:hypothetical protein
MEATMSQTHTLPITGSADSVERHPIVDHLLAALAVVVAIVALVVAVVALRDDAATTTPAPVPPSQPWNVPDCPLHGRC